MYHGHADPSDFPSPDVRPRADVVVYDGQCGMCRSQMERLKRWDRGGRLAYISLHDPRVAERWPDLSHGRLLQEMAVVDREGGRHWGPDAIRYLTRRVPQLWWLAPLLHVPGSMLVWRPLYRWIARHRYWFGGKVHECETGACQLHR
jgi:predicted DCC family thiol-disulfide oxidoreductase YuxK